MSLIFTLSTCKCTFTKFTVENNDCPSTTSRLIELNFSPVNFTHFGPKFLVDAQPQMFGSTFWRSSNTQFLKKSDLRLTDRYLMSSELSSQAKVPNRLKRKGWRKKCFCNPKERKIERQETFSQMVIRATQGLSFPFGSRLFKSFS